MAFMTKDEVKALLGIASADTTRDTLISTLIPLVQKRIVAYCNNSFLLPTIQVYGTTVAFVSGAPATITDSDEGFVDAGFKTTNDVKVGGSASNDGIYNVTTVAAGVLALTTGEVLVDEAAGELVSVTRVKWPEDLKLDAASIINHYLTTQGRLAKSETLPGGYSITYKDDPEVWHCLNQYRKPYR
jgi:hypothetical protein